MAEPIISVSGLRGIVGETLTAEVAARYAAAFSALAPDGAFLITRDGRPSGEMLARAVAAGLQAMGRDTADGGIAATPTTGVLVREMHAAGGIQITASHNPAEYNGLKLFSAEGRVIPAGPGQEVLDRYRAGTPEEVAHGDLGKPLEVTDTTSAHLAAVLATVDVKRIRRRKFRVLLDANHGAGGILGRPLLEALRCDVTVLGEEPNGRFAHPAEPAAENLAGVLAAVTEHRAEIGFCQDPDADRLAVIDQAGRYLGEEYTVAMCVDHVLRRRQGPIAINCSSSRMSQDIAEKYGVELIRSAVGEANVVDAMLEHEALFGGEGNGGPIDPRVGLVRDSFVGMALLLDAIAARERSIAELADELPRYEIVKTKVSLGREKIPRRWTLCSSTSARPCPTGSTGCGSTGPTVGCWSAAATPSRSSGRSPRRKVSRRPPSSAMPQQRCWASFSRRVRPSPRADAPFLRRRHRPGRSVGMDR